MDTIITFTPAQLFQAVLAICGAITAVAAAAAVIISLVKKAKEPNVVQDKRLKALEEKVMAHERYFENDDYRLKHIEKGNRIAQEALLALLSHGIDGNDVESMKKAKDKLQLFLIEK